MTINSAAAVADFDPPKGFDDREFYELGDKLDRIFTRVNEALADEGFMKPGVWERYKARKRDEREQKRKKQQ